MQCDTVCCSVLNCVALWAHCSAANDTCVVLVLRCVAVWCEKDWRIGEGGGIGGGGKSDSRVVFYIPVFGIFKDAFPNLENLILPPPIPPGGEGGKVRFSSRVLYAYFRSF